jgi:hypothetical protein
MLYLLSILYCSIVLAAPISLSRTAAAGLIASGLSTVSPFLINQPSSSSRIQQKSSRLSPLFSSDDGGFDDQYEGFEPDGEEGPAQRFVLPKDFESRTPVYEYGESLLKFVAKLYLRNLAFLDLPVIIIDKNRGTRHMYTCFVRAFSNMAVGLLDRVSG